MMSTGKLTAIGQALARFCCVGLLVSPALAVTPAANGRLPTQVVPDAYRIDLIPDAKNHRFTGTVDIDLRILEPTDRIVLNSADLYVRRAELSGEMAVPTVVYDDKAQTATFVFRHPLEPGHRTLHLSYQGRIYEQSSGLFSLDYNNPQGAMQRALFTQLENADARRVFPCWDEPSLKASFTLSAVLPAAQTAVSNMPIDSIDDLSDDRQRVHFLPTPKMSTYLLFYAQGDLERVHKRVGNTDVGVVVRRGEGAKGQYALDVAAQVLAYDNAYFDTPYPLPKLDMVAAPGASTQFSGMENWGAILYFERSLLVDPQLSSAADRENVFHIVAHEIAHQWFGDLVTMAWWDALWLNEGFATWMDNKVSEHFHPEWQIWARWQARRENAMALDARDGTHPIVTPIHSVVEANGAFDAITYQKGAAVIRTLESFVGEDAFRAGVRAYMREHAYGNAVSDDLWHAIDRLNPQQPVTAIAHGLTLQDGVPVVQEQKLVCQNDQAALSVSLEELHLTAGAPRADKHKRKWELPVRVATVGGEATETHVLRSTAAATTWDLKLPCGPLVLNADQTAYFRVGYSKPQLTQLIQVWSSLTPVNQLAILDDARALVGAHRLPVASYLDVLAASATQQDDSLLTEVVRQTGDLDRLYPEGPLRQHWRARALHNLEPLRRRLGWEAKPQEPETTGKLRSQVLAVLGQMDSPEVVEHMKSLFAGYRAHPETVEAALRHDMLDIVAVHATPEIWAQLHNMAQTAPQETQRLELYRLLGRAQDWSLAKQALNLALQGEPALTTRPEMLLRAATQHPREVFEFVQAHWQEVSAWIEPNVQARFLLRLLEQGREARLADELSAFAKNKLDAGSEGDIRKAVARIREGAEAQTSLVPQIENWLIATQISQGNPQ